MSIPKNLSPMSLSSSLLLTLVVCSLPNVFSPTAALAADSHGDAVESTETADHAKSEHPSPDPHAAHRAMATNHDSARVAPADGLTIPEVPVVLQDGTETSFRDLVGDKVVAMNFVFTTCTTICPPMGANFSKLQKLLGDAAGRDVHLISVSVDPVVDTPERLRAWGQAFGAGPGWTLVTGQKTDITRLLKHLQVFTPDIRDHSPTVILGNAGHDRWTRAYGLATPAKLSEILEQLSHEGASS